MIYRHTPRQPVYARWFQRRCPATAVNGPDDYPRCDLRHWHIGAHEADRGMYVFRWTEQLEGMTFPDSTAA